MVEEIGEYVRPYALVARNAVLGPGSTAWDGRVSPGPVPADKLNSNDL